MVPLENETHMPLQNQYMLNRDLSEDGVKTEVVLSHLANNSKHDYNHDHNNKEDK